MARRPAHAPLCTLVLSIVVVCAHAASDSLKNEHKPLGPVPAASTPDGASQPPATNAGFGRTALALGGVLALVIACGWAARAVARKAGGGGGILSALGPGGRSPSGVLEVLGRFPVGRGSTLVLLKMDRRVLLLNHNTSRMGGGAMNTLCEVTDPEEVASLLLRTRDADGDTLARRFQGLLAKEEGLMSREDRQPLVAEKELTPMSRPRAVSSRLSRGVQA